MISVWSFLKKNGKSLLGCTPLNKDPYDAYVFTGDPDKPVKIRREGDVTGPVLLRAMTEIGEIHVLISGSESRQVRVNGDPLLAGIRILRDRDEILVPGENGDYLRLYFSIELKAEIEIFDSERDVQCVRCHQKIQQGDAVVTCPKCKGTHHEKDELPCWSYTFRCGNGLCGQETDLNQESDSRWTPAHLIDQ